MSTSTDPLTKPDFQTRLLLVEDEEKVARCLMLGLKTENFAIDHASDGLAGLEMALTHPYDLLIVDLMLPKLSGTELVRRIREKDTRLPIVILSARDGLTDKVTNFECGADDYITKPFVLPELLARVKALLRRGPAPRSDIVRIADLEIDRVQHQVRRQSSPIKLTSKEYALLEYLALNAGCVLSRAMIVENVWDQTFQGLTNIVDVYVRQLRAKVDEPFGQKLIRTVRNVGYILSVAEET